MEAFTSGRAGLFADGLMALQHFVYHTTRLCSFRISFCTPKLDRSYISTFDCTSSPLQIPALVPSYHQPCHVQTLFYALLTESKIMYCPLFWCNPLINQHFNPLCSLILWLDPLGLHRSLTSDGRMKWSQTAKSLLRSGS